MLVENMTLKQMLDFKPNDEDMAILPLDIIVYLKVVIISEKKENNYNFIHFFFKNNLILEIFKNIYQTKIYDFSLNNQAKDISILELYALNKMDDTIALLKEVLNDYNHESDLIIDLFSHDNKIYRLSNLDGIIKVEPLHKLN